MTKVPEGVYTVETLPYDIINRLPVLPRPRGNQRQKKTLRYYKNIVCAFDIETSKTEDKQAFMYVWQFQFGLQFTVAGRTWDEFLTMLHRLQEGLQTDQYLAIYVHNLSYEFQFLTGIYDFTSDEVFAMKARRILRCDMFGHFEFRCGYIHSNMSLGEFTSKMGVTHLKLSGEEFGYNVLRYPWTEMTDQEWQYCLNDVRGLVEALMIEMQHDGDNLYTIPSTSTGYVRRDVKKALRKVQYKWLKDQLPNVHVYTMLREAFRGGNTHANRYFAGRELHDGEGVDIASSYTAQIMLRKFPISRFYEMPEPPDMEKLAYYINVLEKAVLARFRIWNVRLKDPFWPCPYLTKDKCRNIVAGAYDNGRILKAEYLETTLTDLDVKVLLEEYDFDNIECTDCAYARYGYLPEPLKEVVRKYYSLKTELKGVEGQEVYYTKAKNKLNSVYGMFAQNPIRPDTVYNKGSFELETAADPDAWLEGKISEYQRKGNFPYQWGVWVSAAARVYGLEPGIRIANELSKKEPRQGFVYADTDSVKYIGPADFSKYNADIIKQAKEMKAYATDPKGVVHYMGVYEFDGAWKKFATRGAKKYICQESEDGHIKVTIAGVNKKKGGQELEAAGGFSAFLRPSFTFYAAGGTESVYNDDIDEMRIIDGHELRITRNVAICDSTYRLHDTWEYADLVEMEQRKLSKFMLDKFGILW